jgi:hypothetical protein
VRVTIVRVSQTVETSLRRSSTAPSASVRWLPVQRITYRVHEAAYALGVSSDWFDDHVAPFVRIIRDGRVRLVLVSDLERWATEASSVLVERYDQR